MISINTNIVLMKIFTKTRSKHISSQSHQDLHVKQNKKQQLADQSESDDELDFKIIEVGQFKHKILQLSTKTSHMKINNMTYHSDLSH